MNEFEGLVAVVTGGASGIGAATAKLLRARGAQVAVLDRAIMEGPDYYICDVSDGGQIDQATRKVAREHGRIDIVINNAAIGAVGDVTTNDDDEWRRVLDVNVLGIVRMSRVTLPYLRQSPSAAIVNTCSIVAKVGVANRALYAASKGAVASLTLAMAADHVREGVRVNAVLPGTADTPWVSRLLADAEDPTAAANSLRRRQPIGRLVTADEVAHAIAYLASPCSQSTTGSLLTVDGGMGSLRVNSD